MKDRKQELFFLKYDFAEECLAIFRAHASPVPYALSLLLGGDGYGGYISNVPELRKRFEAARLSLEGLYEGCEDDPELRYLSALFAEFDRLMT